MVYLYHIIDIFVFIQYHENMSVYLPKSEFNLYSNPKETEKRILDFWGEIKLEQKRNEKRSNAQKFVLHDGPPYANGPIHIGHAENKFWKDALNKFWWQAGYNTVYIMGWDSHGLPIETAVEKEFKEKGIDKSTLSRSEFWDSCYNFSQKWMQTQMEQFKNLGVFGDYEHSYATFFEPESIGIMECAHEFVKAGLIEQRFKPVLWSPAEKTALAYAEVEYKDKASNSIYIYFPVTKTNIKALENAALIVWTTTPWTLSANETVAYNENLNYVIFTTDATEDEKFNKFCILEDLFANIEKDFQNAQIIAKISGKELSETIVTHPLTEFAAQKQLIHSDHVDNQKGTGFVHIAPSHGEDDFALGVKYGLNIEDLLDVNGYFKAHLPLVGSKSIKESEAIIIENLKVQKTLLKTEQIMHSYPHSWRSKAPLIFRLTKQWFMNMGPIKSAALEVMSDPKLGWVPKEGKNRLSAMVEGRDDWCISRQRMWGVPIGIFFKEETGEVLADVEFLDKTRAKLTEIGVKNWWNLEVDDIDPKYNRSEWKRLNDIIEIWFESGATHHFVLKKHGLFPSDVYLEGSDQHRGWFQSSLLISAFLNKCAPWKTLITHGFCLDGSKQKMSKSLGNVVDPATWSADNLRLFFSTANLCYDISMNEQSIKNAGEMMFRFRNTIKFVLGMLAIEKEKNHIDYEEMPLLEKWILFRLTELEDEYKQVLKTSQFMNFVSQLYEFCSQDLSAFYFDIRKDALYCEDKNNAKRRASITCLEILLQTLLKFIAPICPFFAEEAWQIYRKENENAVAIDDIKISTNAIENARLCAESIHLEDAVKLVADYKNDVAKEQIEKIRSIRKQITERIEELREQKIVTTSQETKVIITREMYDSANICNLDEVEFLQILKEVAIVSVVEFGVEFNIEKLVGVKCPRCRFIYEQLEGEFCQRCCVSVSKM